MTFVAHVQMDVLEAYYMIFHRFWLLQKYLQNMTKNAVLQKNMRWIFLFS